MWRAASPPSTRPSTATDMKILDHSHPRRPACIGAALLGGVVSESRSAGPAAGRPGAGGRAALRVRLGRHRLARRAGSRTRRAPAPATPRRTRCSGSPTRSAPARPATRPSTRGPTPCSAARTSSTPKNVYALTGLGGIALARHRFAEALRIGRAAQAAAPGAAAPYGVVGDAQLELGRYREAFATFDRMAALKPNASSYSRVSYARELRGDVAGAIDGDGAGARRLDRPARGHGLDRRRARQAALVGRANRGERVALPLCASGRSRLRPGARRARPCRGGTRPHDPRDRAPAPRGRVDPAAELRRAARRPARERRPYGRGDASSTRSSARSSGCRWRTGSRSTSRPRSTASTTGSACTTRSRSRGGPSAERPSVLGDDVLAWALARNGRCAEALVHSKRSLRLGTRDATFYFHRGDDRALPRPACRRPQLVRARRRAEPALLHSLGTHRTGGTAA